MDQRTADFVGTFKGECRDTRTANSVRISARIRIDSLVRESLQVLLKFGPIRLSVGPCIPFFEIRTDSAVRRSFHSPFKIPTKSAVRGSLLSPFKIWTKSTVRGSLHPPWKIPTKSAVRVLSPLKIWTDSAVRGSLYPPLKIKTRSAVRGSLHTPLKIRSNRRSVGPCFLN